MIFSLISIMLAILWIVIGTSYTKWHPIVVLFTAALLLALLLGIAPIEALELMIIAQGAGYAPQESGSDRPARRGL